jgi:hypothetical protein
MSKIIEPGIALYDATADNDPEEMKSKTVAAVLHIIQSEAGHCTAVDVPTRIKGIPIFAAAIQAALVPTATGEDAGAQRQAVVETVLGILWNEVKTKAEEDNLTARFEKLAEAADDIQAAQE